MKFFVFCVLCVLTLCVHADSSIEAVQGLVSRVIGAQYVNKFQFEVIESNDGLDVFELTRSGQDGTPIIIKGNSPIALSVGFNNYLKYYCKSSVTWGELGSGNNIRVPDVLPPIEETWRNTFAVQYRYYMNVCTVSYSSSFWDWNRWEKEIDWMALNGVNMPLSFTGQEYIWLKVFTAIGIPEEKVLDYFTGPAFFAWLRMGNIQRWGGPLTKNWIKDEWEINLKITERQKEFGMYQVYPAFAGFVPDCIKEIYPNATVRTATAWGDFDPKYTSNTMIDPEDPLFKTIAKLFIETINKELNYTSHYYNTDQFNEMDPKSTDLTYLHDVAKVVYDGIRAADPEGIWVMQGWQFHSPFWTDERLTAYLSGIPDDGLIILDLNSEQGPLYTKFAKNNKKWIWCMLHNYGGEHSMYGGMYNIGSSPVSAHAEYKDTMVGTGMTPEAIEHNPIIYELMNEMGWRNEAVNVEEWTELYIERRYGGLSPSASAAWKHFLKGVYNHEFSWAGVTIGKRPSLSMNIERNRNSTEFLYGFEEFIKSHKEYNTISAPWNYDMVDITRQAIEYIFDDFYFLYQQIALARTYIDDYDIVENTDCPGGDIYKADCGYESPVPCVMEDLIKLCNERPNCGGFNSNGFLKRSCANKITSQGTNTYTRKYITGDVDYERAKKISTYMLEMIKDTDKILATNPNFMLGTWTHRAQQFAHNEEERRWLDFNAKNQITLWGPRGEINDYATKAWSGLVGTYHYDRWNAFFDTCHTYIQQHKEIDLTEYFKQTIQMGYDWDADGVEYPNEPVGDTYLIAQELHDKYLTKNIAHYKKLENTSSEVGGYIQTMSTNIPVLALLCDADIYCKGFSTEGYLFLETATPVARQGVDFYAKN